MSTDQENGNRRSSLTRAIPTMLAVLYAPYAWIVLIDYPWNDYRWYWVKCWAVLPGLVPGMAVTHDNDTRVAVMAVATVVIVATVLRLLTGSKRRALLVASSALVLSAINSWIAYQGFWV